MVVIMFVNSVILEGFVIMSNTEVLLIGFMGGSIGAICMMFSLQTYYKHTLKQYLDAQYSLKKQYEIRNLNNEIITLRMQVTALQSQFGVNDKTH